jgi:amino acid adenylation domain-containing protein
MSKEEARKVQGARINGFRLSPQQKRAWLLQQNGQSHQMQCAILLEGDLRKEGLRSALQDVVDRYEIFRTVFRRLPGMEIPVQIVAKMDSPSWQELNLSDLECQSQDHRVEEMLNEQSRLSFDSERGPLLKSVLLKLSGERHILAVTLPSLLADTRTLNNFVEELSRGYGRETGGESSEEMLQYIQFSEWQNQLLEEADGDTGRNYWHKQSVGSNLDLALPFERKSLNDGAFEPRTWTAVIRDDLVAKIATVTGRHKIASDLFLLACWQTLLWKLTRKQDVIVGVACDGRDYEILDKAMGLFAKWLPVVSHFEDNFRFREILSRVNESMLGAQEWKEYFGWELIEILKEQAWFPIGFQFERRVSKQVVADLSWSIHRLSGCIEPFKIMLSCAETEDGLIAEFNYDARYFRSDDIERLAEQYEVLLTHAVNDCEALVRDIEILSESARHQLLIAFNDTCTGYHTDKLVHQLFEEQVDRAPNRIAVTFRDQQLSYAELNAKANRLAHHLRSLGVCRETLVGISMERSVNMLVGWLGILKSGGAYVPLDPTYPKDRLAFMLEDARVGALITERALVGHLPEHCARIVCIDGDWQEISTQNEENPVGDATPDNLAYVIYTSGSTGRPKGVMIQHRSIVNLTAALYKAIYADCGESLRISLNAPLSFDASVKQLVQLLFGHTLCILPEEVRPDAHGLLSYSNHQTIDVLDCTPSQLKLLVAAGLTQDSYDFPNVVLVGGEEIDQYTWSALGAAQPISFYNVYGPTECTVDAAVCRVRGDTARPTIGRPVANTQIYLLDHRLRPVPIEVPAELCISGHGLARGYLNRPDLTAEKFMPDPFSRQSGERLYRTGDLAKYQADGKAEFLGRTDYQIKLRGYRIELKEIEAVLMEHPAIRETTVIKREDEPGNERLIGYIVPGRQQAPSTAEISDWLKQKIPDYMVPASFVTLDKLPLTRNGKVDRTALPDLEFLPRESKAVYVAPRTEVERRIAEICREVLRVEKIGVNDNFFDLGGHSLLMVQVHNKLQEEFKNAISMIELFRNPTVRSLAQYFTSEQSEQRSLLNASDRASRRKEAMNKRKQIVNERQTAINLET